jgi:DNA sulfur modification protein DndE
MADKLKISVETSDKLNHLSARLDLRRNIICRIAIGKSFSMNTRVENGITGDSGGYEFNKTTIMGSEEFIFKAIASNLQGYPLYEDIFFNVIIRNHIERGMAKLFEEYERINSPAEFMKRLISDN